MNDGLLLREFSATELNREWATNITKHLTAEGKSYCCAINDPVSKRLVGHEVSDRITSALAATVLWTALAHCEPDGVVIVHAHRGAQYRVRHFQAFVKALGHRGFMSQVALAADNGATESFCASLKRNVLNAGPWRSRAERH